jgi:hypothetical protein
VKFTFPRRLPWLLGLSALIILADRITTGASMEKNSWRRVGSIRIAAGIRCASRGCWFRRTAPSAPGRAKSARRPRPRRFPTTRSAIFAPATSGPAEPTNPAYDGVFSFVNDYAALLPESPPHRGAGLAAAQGRARARPVQGALLPSRPQPDPGPHDPRGDSPVVDAWTREYLELGGLDWIEYVQIFENRGAMMGASNPHPHGQIWSTGFVPDEPAAETQAQRDTWPAPAAACSATTLRPSGSPASALSLRMSTSWPWSPGGPSGPSRCCWSAAATWARCRS